jgi:tetratricopeptide (TPR) repeat protein
MADTVPDDGPLTLDQAYAVLEVANTHKGNLDEVKKAYRKLCLKWHPDKNPPEKEQEAKQRFTRITAAYHTITTNNFDYQRWARSYEIPSMQTLEDVLKMALSGRDPFEIEAMLRARGDYRPAHNFGVDVNVPWTAGKAHDPSFDVGGPSGYRKTMSIEDTRRQMELMWDEGKVAGASEDRPWERVGGVGFDGDVLKNGPLKLGSSGDDDIQELLAAHVPDWSRDMNAGDAGAAATAERINDVGVGEFIFVFTWAIRLTSCLSTGLFNAKKYKQAFEAYTACLHLAPDKVAYLGNRAAAGLRCKGKERDVVNDCERAVELQPDYARGYARMGQALLALGDAGEYGDVVTLRRAKAALKKALELDPSSGAAKKTLKEVGMSLMLHADSDDEDSD